MGTGLSGTFVIRWSRVSVDGILGAPFEDMRPGVTWSYSGRAIRIDGPDQILRLGPGEGVAELHRRASAKARAICGRVAASLTLPGVEEERIFDRCFVVTDGLRAFMASRIDSPSGPLVAFIGDLPPEEQELWIVRISTTPRAEARARMPLAEGCAGFVAGTLIDTPLGPCAVEALRPGEWVETLDGGARPLVAVETQRVSGARLHITPSLRPILLKPCALGDRVPAVDLRVAPSQRLLIVGAAARALFAEAEVLVRAQDLLDLPGVAQDISASSASYIQLVFESPEIVCARGLACEAPQPNPLVRRTRLENGFPAAGEGSLSVAEVPPVRRHLGPGEAAILVSGMA